jgi:hypothetical protein
MAAQRLEVCELMYIVDPRTRNLPPAASEKEECPDRAASLDIERRDFIRTLYVSLVANTCGTSSECWTAAKLAWESRPNDC